MADYSAAELSVMQEQAAARVREMRARSKYNLERANGVKTGENGEKTGENSPKIMSKKPIFAPQSFNLAELLQDGDSALIIIILLLLGGGEHNERLTLALLYIML